MPTGLSVTVEAVVIHELGCQIQERTQGLLLSNELLARSGDMKQVKNVSTFCCCVVQIPDFAQLVDMVS